MEFLVPVREYNNQRSYHLLFLYIETLLEFFIQLKSRIFLNNFSIGTIIFAYPSMNFLWYHVCPNVVHNYVTTLGGSKSTMTKIFAGSTMSPCLQTTCPQNIPNGTKNMHLFIFKEISCCPQLSIISPNLPTCLFNSLNIL